MQLFFQLNENFTTQEALEKGINLGMEKRTIESPFTCRCNKILITRFYERAMLV